MAKASVHFFSWGLTWHNLIGQLMSTHVNSANFINLEEFVLFGLSSFQSLQNPKLSLLSKTSYLLYKMGSKFTFSTIWIRLINRFFFFFFLLSSTSYNLLMTPISFVSWIWLRPHIISSIKIKAHGPHIFFNYFMMGFSNNSPYLDKNGS